MLSSSVPASQERNQHMLQPRRRRGLTTEGAVITAPMLQVSDRGRGLERDANCWSECEDDFPGRSSHSQISCNRSCTCKDDDSLCQELLKMRRCLAAVEKERDEARVKCQRYERPQPRLWSGGAGNLDSELARMKASLEAAIKERDESRIQCRQLNFHIKMLTYEKSRLVKQQSESRKTGTIHPAK
jgi:hypothetical protein